MHIRSFGLRATIVLRDEFLSWKVLRDAKSMGTAALQFVYYSWRWTRTVSETCSDNKPSETKAASRWLFTYTIYYTYITIKRRKPTWICHVMVKNYLLKHIIKGKREGKMEVMRRRGRRLKQLLDDLKEKKGYWKLKEKAPHHTLWRIHFGRGVEPGGR